MQQQISEGHYYEIGNIIKKAIFAHETLDLTPVIPFLRYIDFTILATYFVFNEKQIPDELRALSSGSIELESIITAFDIYHKASNADITVLLDLEKIKKFDAIIPEIILTRARLLAYFYDRNPAIYDIYNDLSKYDRTFTLDLLEEYGDIAAAFGLKAGKILHGCCLDYLEQFQFVKSYINLQQFEKIEAISYEFEGFKVEISELEMEKWQHITAVMNYLMNLSVSDRAELSYSKIMREIDCGDEQELELLLAEMSVLEYIQIKLNEIAKVIKVKYVKPMVLDEHGKEIIVERLKEWESRIQSTIDVFEKVFLEEEAVI